jgi:hypothetical protein
MLLRATAAGDDAQQVAGGAAIKCHVSMVETDNATPPVVQDLPRTNTASITTATTTTIADCTTSNRRRRVLFASINNDHASATETVEVVHSDGTTVSPIVGCTLLAGEALIFNGASWFHYDVNGALYPSVGNAATQAEQEAGTATDKYVTPGRQHFHPSAVKCWGKANGAGTSLIVNYNVSSITDTGTGQLTVNVGTDFSSADYSVTTSVERVSTSLAVANVDNGGLLRNASQAAGSFQIENYDDTATTHVAQDPAAYHWQCCGDQA